MRPSFIHTLKNTALYVFLGAVAFGMIFPLLWMILFSLRESPQQYSSLTDILLAPTTFTNYADAFASDNFGKYFINSLLVSCIVTAGNVIFCLWAGYAFARRSFWGKTLYFGVVLAMLMVPQQVLMIPLYRLMVSLGWLNTYWALTLPWLVSPFGIFLLRQYIAAIPTDIEDAARIDGAGEWYIMFRIMLPLCTPVLTILAIFTFLSTWNSFLYPFLFTNDAAHRTLPVGLAFYIGKQSIDWGRLMAGAGISAIPVLLAFLFFQKHIIKGMTAGALKE